LRFDSVNKRRKKKEKRKKQYGKKAARVFLAPFFGSAHGADDKENRSGDYRQYQYNYA